MNRVACLVVRLVFLCAMVLFSRWSIAQSQPEDFDGIYALQLGERSLLVLHIETKGGHTTGTLERPKKFSGNIQFAVEDPTVVTYVLRKFHTEDGKLHFTTAPPAGSGGDSDDYILTITSDATAQMVPDLDGFAVEPMPLLRVKSATVATDWQIGRRYGLGDSDVDNPEMKRIFKADQDVRQELNLSKQDWKQVAEEDAARRVRVHTMLEQGLLHTGADFERASFIFQHGHTPDEYLLAHTLAMIAVSKGDSSAIWVASATLDRYLQSIGKPQIFGTQFVKNKEMWTQDPYERTLVPDRLRRALDVPSQAVQQQQLENYNKGSHGK